MKTALLATAAAAASILAAGAGVAPAQAASYHFTTLTAPGGGVTTPDAISSNGLILLQNATSTFLYDPATSTYSPLPNDDPAAIPGTTAYQGVNTSGQIVGDYNEAGSGAFQSLLYSGGSFSNVTPPFGLHDFSEASGINDAGQFVGTWEVASNHEQGYLFSGGGYTVIDFPGANLATQPFAINNLGEIVGADYSTDPSVSGVHGFTYQGGAYTALDAPGELITNPLGINDSGEIVGVVSNDPTEATGRAFVYQGGQLRTFSAPGAVETVAFGVDSQGQIVGDAFRADGSYYGFLATPAVPEAPAWAALLIGFGALGAVARRRRVAIAQA